MVYRPGQSGNPGGRPSIVKDLERAKQIGVPPEVQAALTEWFQDADEHLSKLGAQGFVAGLQQALQDAAAKVLPVNLDEARAMWWRTILPIAFAGPLRDKDSNWQYAHDTVGVRLLGKPKEHVVLEGSDATPIDWTKVPEEEREELLKAIIKLQAYLGESPSSSEH